MSDSIGRVVTPRGIYPQARIVSASTTSPRSPVGADVVLRAGNAVGSGLFDPQERLSSSLGSVLGFLGRVAEVFALPKTNEGNALPHGDEKLGCRWGDRHKLVSPLLSIRKTYP